MKKERVCVIGSGNWGSTIARIVGENVKRFAEFEDTVKMWVFEEEVEGKKLTDIINTEHENVKYLPGFKIPTNVIAEADLVNAAKTATILIFVLPHQFVTTTCTTLKPHIDPKTCRAVSLIKGIDAGKQGFKLISDDIQDLLLGIDVSVLMGANIATEVAKEQFCETTIGYRVKENAVVLKRLFHTDFFRVSMVHDVAGTEICGALKNVVALAAGFVDGLGYGGNTKAAVMRIGLMEMRKFAHMFYDGVRDETFLESCGVADLITTCHGGRNRMVAEAMVTTGRGIDELEAEMLNGQKLQGSSTAQEVYELLSARGVAQEFPLLTTVYRIAYEDVPAARILVDI